MATKKELTTMIFLLILAFWAGTAWPEENNEDTVKIPLNEYNLKIENGEAIFTERDSIAAEERDKKVEFIKTGKAKEITKLYEEWLDGYIQKGGNPTHQYDYPFERLTDQFEIAQNGDVIKRLCGSNAKTYIVPEGTSITIEDLGHSRILYMENFTIESNVKWIPVCNDLESPSGNTKVNEILEKNKKKAIEDHEQFLEKMGLC